MKVVRFTVHDPLMGYRRPKDKNSDYKRYQEFKEKVRILAYAAGWRAVDPKVVKVYLSVEVSWVKEPRCDWSNVFKSIEDALFSQDRWVRPGGYSGLNPFDGVECANVHIDVVE